MWNELKRTFRANKIIILISTMIFVFISLLTFLDKINVIKGLDDLFVGIFGFLAQYICATLILLFAYKKSSFEDFYSLLPRTRLRQFLNKFIPGYLVTNISSIAFIILIMKLSGDHIDFRFLGYLSTFLGLFYFIVFVIIFLYNSLKYICYILPALILIWELIFPIVIQNPLFPELVYSQVYWNIGVILLAFLIPLILYIVFYRKNPKFHIVVLIVTVFFYILLSQGIKILKHYDHSGRVINIYAYDRYISVVKSDIPYKQNTIFHNLQTKKKIKKISLGFNVQSWDKDRFIFSMQNEAFMKIKGFAPMKLSERNKYIHISINVLQDNYITNSFICKSGKKIYEVNLETYTIEEIKHSNHLTKRFWRVIRKELNVGNFIISTKFGKIPTKSYYTNLVYDCSTYYNLQRVKGAKFILYDKNHNLVDVGDNKLILLRGGRVGYLDNDRKFFLLHRGQYIESDLDLNGYNTKFIEEKYYFTRSNKIIFGDLDTKKVHYQKFKAADIKQYSYMVYKYKAEYYLFLYARNPVKVYKFTNGKWEFYDKIW